MDQTTARSCGVQCRRHSMYAFASTATAPELLNVYDSRVHRWPLPIKHTPCRPASRPSRQVCVPFALPKSKTNSRAARHTRWSLVYFIRPAYEEVLRPLSEQSQVIEKAAASNESIRNMDKGVTAEQWFKRRITNQRVANRKGPETWLASRGTEHTPQAA